MSTPSIGLDAYRVQFPEELHAIWRLAGSIDPADPCHAFEPLLGISLCGPYDILAGAFDGLTPALCMLLHWRHDHDQPELVTVATGNEDGHHIGYWFDDGRCASACVQVYTDTFTARPYGRTLIEALRVELERRFEAELQPRRTSATCSNWLR